MATKSAKDLVAEANRNVETLSGAEAAKLVGNADVVFVDIRESDESQKTGILKGAVHVPRVSRISSRSHQPSAQVGTRRRQKAWTIAAGVLLLICFFLMPPPQPEPGLMPVNINYVWGPSDHFRQTWVSAAAWLIGLIVGLPIVVYAPTHTILMHLAPMRLVT